MKKLFLVLITFHSLFFFFPVLAQSPFQDLQTSSRLQAQLQRIVQTAVERNFNNPESLPDPLDPFFLKPLPVFVTAKKNGVVRGCMGSLRPRASHLAEEIQINLERAFSQDLWHRPIRKDEVPGMEIYISTVGNPQPVLQMGQLIPERDGVLIRSGSKEAVLLPGEARTQRYMLAFLKAKAGIRKGEPYQLYRLPTWSFKVQL